MSKRRTFTALTLAALAAAACGDDVAPASQTQEGSPHVQGDGQSPQRGAATVVRDTTPHRPDGEQRP